MATAPSAFKRGSVRAQRGLTGRFDAAAAPMLRHRMLTAPYRDRSDRRSRQPRDDRAPALLECHRPS